MLIEDRKPESNIHILAVPLKNHFLYEHSPRPKRQSQVVELSNGPRHAAAASSIQTFPNLASRAVEHYIAEQTTANGANSGQTEEPADEKPTLTN